LLKQPPAAAPPSPPAPSYQEPGAFTKMFGGPAAPGRTSPIAQPPVAPPAAPPSGTTNLFSRALPGSPAAPAPPPTQTGPGEYTRLFTTVGPPASQPAPPTASPSVPVQQGPSEYTRLFSAPPAQSPMLGMPAPPATPIIPPVYGVPASGVPMPPPAFGAPARPAAPMAPPVYRMPAQPPAVMPRPPAMPAPPAPSLNLPATQLPAGRPSSSNLALYIILGGLFLIALFLVVFFALKS